MQRHCRLTCRVEVTIRNTLKRQQQPSHLLRLHLFASNIDTLTPIRPFFPLYTTQAIYNSTEVTQVNIASSTGDMGILASHVPAVEELRPGVLEVVESSGSKKWFVSGGFATVHPNNKLVVNAIEAYPLEQFSAEAVRSALSEAQRVASSGSSAEAKAEAEIEIEVYTALQAALGRS